MSGRNRLIEENCSFVVDNVLEGDAEGRVQIVEELLVENERNSWNKKMSLKKTAQTSSFFLLFGEIIDKSILSTHKPTTMNLVQKAIKKDYIIIFHLPRAEK